MPDLPPELEGVEPLTAEERTTMMRVLKEIHGTIVLEPRYKLSARQAMHVHLLRALRTIHNRDVEIERLKSGLLYEQQAADYWRDRALRVASELEHTDAD